MICLSQKSREIDTHTTQPCVRISSTSLKHPVLGLMMETGGALLTELLECDIVKLESSKVLRYFPPGNGNLSDLEHNPLKSENTMDRRVEIKKNPTKSKTARVKDNERGETDVEAAVERKGDKSGNSEIPIEELSRDKGKKKQGRTKGDKKERKRLMSVLILNHRCSLPTGGRRLQSISSSWRCTGTQCPQLNLH